MLSSKDSAKHVTVCRRVAAAGITAVRFDFAGRGSSDGDPELFTVSREVEDLGDVIAWMTASGTRRLALVGSSLGGAVSLLVAARGEPVVGLATIASPATLPDRARASWGGGGREVGDRVEVAPGVLISAQLFRDAAHHDLLAAAARVRVPWLVVHGAEDEVVPFADGERLAAAAPAARLLPVAGADHRFEAGEHRERLIAAVVDHVTGCF